MNNQYIQKALPPPRSRLVEKCAQTFSKLFLSIKTIFLIYKSLFVLITYSSISVFVKKHTEFCKYRVDVGFCNLSKVNADCTFGKPNRKFVGSLVEVFNKSLGVNFSKEHCLILPPYYWNKATEYS